MRERPTDGPLLKAYPVPGARLPHPDVLALLTIWILQ